MQVYSNLNDADPAKSWFLHQAAKALDEAVILAPGDGIAIGSLALVKYYLNDIPAARELAQKALAINPHLRAPKYVMESLS